MRERQDASATADEISTSIDGRVEGLFRVGIVAAVLAAVVLAASGVVNNRILPVPKYQLNPDLELTVWSWAGSSFTFAAAAAVVTAALLRVVPRRQFVLAGLLAYLSVDDNIGIHEMVGRWLLRVGVPDGIDTVLWPFLLSPVLGLTFLLLLDAASSAPRTARRLVIVGLGLLVAAILLEIVWGPLYDNGLSRSTVGWGNTVEVAAEEGAELAAWILISTALVGTMASAVARPLPEAFPGALDSLRALVWARRRGRDCEVCE